MTHVIEVADARLKLAQPSFDDSYASATHAAEVGNGGLTPPCPMRDAGWARKIGSMSRKNTYTSGHVIEVADARCILATHVAEIADVRLTHTRLIAQPSFGDSYLASTIHIVDVGNGGLTPPCPKALSFYEYPCA